MSLSPILELGIVVARILVGLTLVMAGWLKLEAGSYWVLNSLLAYDLVHGRMAILLSKGLPWVEIFCGAFLMLGLFTPVVIITSFIILLAFTLAIATAILRDKLVDCGCFGRSTKMSRARWTLVYRNMILMGLLLPVYAFGGSRLSVDAWLKIYRFNSGSDVLVQTWLIALWIFSLSWAIGLQVMTRKRLAGSSNKEVAKPSRSET